MKSKVNIINETYRKFRIVDLDKVNWNVAMINEMLDVAMSEYAKQEAITFAEWLYDSRYIMRGSYTTEDLYNLFLESKKQKV